MPRAAAISLPESAPPSWGLCWSPTSSGSALRQPLFPDLGILRLLCQFADELRLALRGGQLESDLVLPLDGGGRWFAHTSPLVLTGAAGANRSGLGSRLGLSWAPGGWTWWRRYRWSRGTSLSVRNSSRRVPTTASGRTRRSLADLARLGGDLACPGSGADLCGLGGFSPRASRPPSNIAGKGRMNPGVGCRVGGSRFTLVGGREQGFRGYSYVTNPAPGAYVLSLRPRMDVRSQRPILRWSEELPLVPRSAAISDGLLRWAAGG